MGRLCTPSSSFGSGSSPAAMTSLRTACTRAASALSDGACWPARRSASSKVSPAAVPGSQKTRKHGRQRSAHAKNRIIMARFLGVLHAAGGIIRRSARGRRASQGGEGISDAADARRRRRNGREGTRDRRRRAARNVPAPAWREHRHKRAAGLALMPAVAQRIALVRVAVFIRRAPYGRGARPPGASFCI